MPGPGTEQNNEAAELAEIQRLLEEGQAALDAATDLPSAQSLTRCDEALSFFKRARELAGDHPEMMRTTKLAVAAALSQRGHQHRYARDYSASLADLSQALRLNPDNAEDYYYRAMSYLAKGDTRLARTDLTEYLRRGTNDYLRDAARDRLSALVPGKDEPQGATTAHWRTEGMRLNSLAALAANPREGGPDWAKAVALYNKAIEAFNRGLETNSADMMTKLGLLAALTEQAEGYRQMEEYDLALENYDRAQAVRPNPRFIFLRAETLLQTGHKSLARQAFEEYLRVGDDPSLKAAAQKGLAASLAKDSGAKR